MKILEFEPEQKINLGSVQKRTLLDYYLIKNGTPSVLESTTDNSMKQYEVAVPSSLAAKARVNQ